MILFHEPASMIADQAAQAGLRLCCSRTAKSVFSRQSPLYYTLIMGRLSKSKDIFSRRGSFMILHNSKSSEKVAVLDIRNKGAILKESNQYLKNAPYRKSMQNKNVYLDDIKNMMWKYK